jgi:hypothetical protein
MDQQRPFVWDRDRFVHSLEQRRFPLLQSLALHANAPWFTFDDGVQLLAHIPDSLEVIFRRPESFSKIEICNSKF